jgi:hypothetical protein
MTTSKKKAALGNNPLKAVPSPASTGIFSPTIAEPDSPETADLSPDNPELAEPVARKQPPESGRTQPDSGVKKKESRKKKKESVFLDPEVASEDKDRVNLRLPVELNDWLDGLLKKGKRQHGQKIPKEIWMQAALELFKAMPVDWTTIGTEDDLRATMVDLESRIKNQEE